MLNNQKRNIVLREKQKEAVDYITGNFQKFPLIEAPTGFGKTIVLLESAIKLQKMGYTVVISTPNNKLTIDAYKEAASFYPNLPISFAIGINNYIDVAKVYNCKNSGALEQYIDMDSFRVWEDNCDEKEDLLFDDFNEVIKYKDIAYQDLVKELICKTKREDESFPDNSIVFTNHFYLLSYGRSAKRENLKNIVLLVDEVHELETVAETIFQNSFSPFFLKSITGRLISELKESDKDFVGKKSMEKELNKTYAKISEEFSKIMSIRSTSMVGEFDLKNKELYLKSLNSINSEALKSLSARITKFLKKNSNISFRSKGIYHALLNETKELKGITESIKSGNDVNVLLSPSKGYPTYKSTKGRAATLLKNFLWDHIVGMAGVSATLNTTVNPQDEVNKKFAYGRIGLDYFAAPEIITFKREFPKENVKLITKPIKQYSMDYEAEEAGADSDLIRWASEIAEHIKKTYDNKNSMVIAGGFKEVEYIGRELESLNLKNIITAHPNEKTITTIKRFTNTGGILVGTRNYGTGISLDGEQLERLYIVKLPYPQVTAIKWIKLKEFSEPLFWINFNNEMIMQLRQFFGRLQRTKKDKGEIHLLDARGIKGEDKKYSKSIVSKVKHYMQEYGIFDEKRSSIVVKPRERYFSGEMNIDAEDLF
ncbi:helicase C-terminal domain-containing protein [Sulfurimonas indica]|uniref:helicase C-terminal domain-containing protein n=1 Tax=Sulfurimonas TaxID=202746 RepID=UPI0012641118|nr:helicase C-terminal domain-containing protein [Sulfurimonas indica]